MGTDTRPAAIAQRRAELGARRPGPDHRRRVRARVLAGQPQRARRRPERRVPVRGRPVDQRRGGAGCGACTRHRRGRAGRIYLLGQRGCSPATTAGRASAAFRQCCRRGRDDGAGGGEQIQSEILLAVIDGALMASEDGGRQWQRRADGLGDAPIDTIVLDPSIAAPDLGRGGGPHPCQRRSGLDLARGRAARYPSPARTCAASQPTRPRRPW